MMAEVPAEKILKCYITSSESHGLDLMLVEK
jgi:hypothetical protein